MAKIDELKERLTMLRFWLGIVVATFLAIAGWSITNYQKVETWLIIGALVLLCFCVVIAFFINKAIDKKCKEIGKIE
ncbi:hypothetical protein [uncultured Helicobacter sp.]|uniref:hypothetical protein n=1 Tax=uncultured Helicobacter sp. TaxID=175537 RepID=UPI00374F151B